MYATVLQCTYEYYLDNLGFVYGSHDTWTGGLPGNIVALIYPQFDQLPCNGHSD